MTEDAAAPAEGGAPAATTATDAVPGVREDAPRLLGAEPAASAEASAAPAQDRLETAKTQASAPAAPEKYELAVPEGMRLQPGQMQAFEGMARELGLTGEQAQKLLEASHANQSAAAQQQAAQVRQWADEARNDPEIGGTRFEENVGIANTTLKRFDPDGRITKILQETGYGNHPDVVRIFARIGRGIAEDAAPAGAAGAQAPELPLSDRLYPNWTVKR